MAYELAALLHYFYPRPPRGGRRSRRRPLQSQRRISIHALREEGDGSSNHSCGLGEISIHALREEGDYAKTLAEATNKEFLSTPSARRATTMGSKATKAQQISIHALREEGDCLNISTPV